MHNHAAPTGATPTEMSVRNRTAGTIPKPCGCCRGERLRARRRNPDKVLHIATFDIETFDPQQYNDEPSNKVISAIFEGLYESNTCHRRPSSRRSRPAGSQ